MLFRSQSLCATDDGGFIAVSDRYNLSDSSTSALLIKLNRSGGIEWKEAYDPPSSAYSCLQADDGGFVIAGTDGNRTLLIKTDALGHLQWRKTYGSAGTVWAWQNGGHGIIRDKDGGYVVAGQTDGCQLLLKTDADGNQLWMKKFPPVGDFNDIVLTADGCYAMTGTPGILAMKTTRDGRSWPYMSVPVQATIIDL